MWLLITIDPAQVYQLCSTEALEESRNFMSLWGWGRGEDAMFSEMDIHSESHLPLLQSYKIWFFR